MGIIIKIIKTTIRSRVSNPEKVHPIQKRLVTKTTAITEGNNNSNNPEITTTPTSIPKQKKNEEIFPSNKN